MVDRAARRGSDVVLHFVAYSLIELLE